MSRERYTVASAPPDWLEADHWPVPDISGLTDAQKRRFQAMSELIREYIARRPVTSAMASHAISWEQLIRAFNRCLRRDRLGRLIGWFGLIPNQRLSAPVRRKPLAKSPFIEKGGLSGALQLLLRERQDIHGDLDNWLLRMTRSAPDAERKILQRSAHSEFLQICRRRGIGDDEWPFNTVRLGLGAIRVYVAEFIDARYDDIVVCQFGQKASAKANTGRGVPSRLTASRVYDVVELDEHKAHFVGAVGIDTDDGVRWIAVGRVTIILAVDRGGLILGFKIILRREANAEDVLDVLHDVFNGGTHYVYSSQRYNHLEKAFPGYLGGDFAACAFNQLLVDNALVHYAKPVIDRARLIGGFDVNYGPVRRFERRPIVEGIFNEIARQGFHRLSSTTGTGPEDPRRSDPEEAAINQRMMLTDLIDLVTAQIADHNGRPGKPRFGVGQMEFIRSLLCGPPERQILAPVVPPLPFGLASLDITVERLNVRGSRVSGRRPYVQLDEESYHGPELSGAWDLIGEQVIAHIHRSDIRKFELFRESGCRIGEVVVAGRWSRTAHTRDVRKYINALIRTNYLRVRLDQDPVQIYLELVRERAAHAKAAESKTIRNHVLIACELGLVANKQLSRDVAGALQSISIDKTAAEPIQPSKGGAWDSEPAQSDGAGENGLPHFDCFDDLIALNGGFHG